MDVCPVCGSDNIFYSKKSGIYCCEDCFEKFDQPRNTQSGLQLFFSYGHDENKPLVLKIKEHIEKRGHTVWIDQSAIRFGDDWRRRITDGILGSNSVVAFMSRHSVREPGVCLDELRIALCVKGAQIKTILTEKEDVVQPPASLCDNQWLDMSRWKQMLAEGEAAFETWFQEKMDELVTVLESESAVNFNGEIQTLKSKLRPSLSDQKEYRLIKQELVGRQWLIDSIEQWRQNDEMPRTMLITGTAGTGKSAFAAHCIHSYSNVLAGIFFEWDKPESYSFNGFVRTLAFKLAIKLEDYRKQLLYILQNTDINILSDSQLLEGLVIDPLSSCIDGQRQTGIILLDGLDEIGQGGEPMLEAFVRSMDKLPRWIRFLLTSRPDEELEALLPGCEQLSLNDETRTQKDIAEYVLARLGESVSMQTALDIAQRSEGSFLYVLNLCDAIAAGTMDVHDLQSLPAGISGVYYQNFCRAFPTEEEYKEVRQLLEILCVDGSAPRRILKQLLDLDSYAFVSTMRKISTLVITQHDRLGKAVRTIDKDLLKKLQEQFPELSGHLQVQSNVSGVPDSALIKLCHKSVGDWLVDSQKAGRFWVDRHSGSRKLAECGLKVVYGYMNELEKREKDKNYDYFLSRLPDWLADSGMWVEYEKLLIDKENEKTGYWAKIDMDFYNSHEAYDTALWRNLSRFPKDYPMDALYEKLRETIRRPAELRRNGIHSGAKMYRYIFKMLGSQMDNPVIREILLEMLQSEQVLAGYFRSPASDSYFYSGLPDTFNADKIHAAASLFVLLRECEVAGLQLPEELVQSCEEVRLYAFFLEGRYRDLDCVQMNFPFMFANEICMLDLEKICRQSDGEVLAKAKRDFNTTCLADHIFRSGALRLDYIQKLVAHDADITLIKANCQNLQGNTEIHPNERKAIVRFLAACDTLGF